MGLTTGGVEIVCEKCECFVMDGKGIMEVHVPVRDGATGKEATAVLLCDLSASEHKVELARWSDGDGQPWQSLEAAMPKIDAALRLVANRKLCGKACLCPKNAVELAAATQANQTIALPIAK